MIDSVYRRHESFYPKVFFKKYNSNYSYNINSHEECFDDSYDSYEKISIKKTPTRKPQIKKIKFIDLFLEEVTNPIRNHPKKHKIFVPHPFQEKLYLENI